MEPEKESTSEYLALLASALAVGLIIGMQIAGAMYGCYRIVY